MNETTKESRFLEAINKYAESQKAQMAREIEDYKSSRIEQATEQGLQDAYDLIRKDISERKSKIINDTAKKELAIRKELFEHRQMIFDKVFEEAESRLRDFVGTKEYNDFLRDKAGKAAGMFSGEACVVYISPDDEDKRSVISEKLSDASFKTDKSISIGGVRIYCRSLGITADCTLDAGLEEQRRWFIENSGLKVV